MKIKWVTALYQYKAALLCTKILKGPCVVFNSKLLHLGFFAGERFADIEEVDSVLEGEGDDVLVDLTVVVGEGLEAPQGYTRNLNIQTW